MRLFETPDDAAQAHLLSEIGYASLPPPPSETPRQRFTPIWSELLVCAVKEPGLILDAYTRFHGYSLGNCFAALVQCEMRCLDPGPLNTYPGWQALGRKVKAGEKALTLCMPLTGKKKLTSYPTQETAPDEESQEGVEVEFIRAFAWKPHWFVLSQTEPLEGSDESAPLIIEAPSIGAWDEEKALTELGITRIPFEHPNGNIQGLARENSVAVSPLAALPHKTLFHELAHIVLGHTKNGDLSDESELTASLIEVEAESVALLLLATFGLQGQEYCRGYIQHWLRGSSIPDSSAWRIFAATEKILTAGTTLERGRKRPAGEPEPDPKTAEELEASPSPPLPQQPARTDSPPPPEQLPENGPSHITFFPNESDAWRLHARLEEVHAALHPDDFTTRKTLQRALKHIEARDPDAAQEIRTLVKEASRQLKAARERLEHLLDSESHTIPENETKMVSEKDD